MAANLKSLWEPLGVTGVAEYAGILSDRYAETLRGPEGITKMARVLRREPAAYAAWSAVALAATTVRWSVTPAAESKVDQDAAEFVQSCLDDMTTSHTSTIRYALSSRAFGYADEVIWWKRRLGSNPDKGLSLSKWDDERVGVRKLLPLRQETILRWVNDEHGAKKGLIQQDPSTGKQLPEIPIERVLHYVGGDERGSWEGLGWLEPGYWLAYLIEQLEQIGGVAAQRAATGLPVFRFLQPPDSDAKRDVDAIGDGLSANELQYVKLPGPMVEFDLKTVSLSNLGEIRGWIDQLRWELSALQFATFLRLGSTERGTQSLAGTIMDAFTLGIDGALDDVTDVRNRYLVPRIIANNPDFNGKISDHPRITHSRVTTLPPATAQWLANIADFMGKADPADVEWIRSIMNMPYKSAKDIAKAQAEKAKAEESAQKQALALAAKQAAQQPPAAQAKPGEPVATNAKQPVVAGAKAEAGAKQPEAEPAGKTAKPAETQASYPAAVNEAMLMAAQRIVAGQLDDQDADLFNPYHHPAGSPKGGQFANAPGNGGAGLVWSKGGKQAVIGDEQGVTARPANYSDADDALARLIEVGDAGEQQIARLSAVRDRLCEDAGHLVDDLIKMRENGLDLKGEEYASIVAKRKAVMLTIDDVSKELNAARDELRSKAFGILKVPDPADVTPYIPGKLKPIRVDDIKKGTSAFAALVSRSVLPDAYTVEFRHKAGARSSFGRTQIDITTYAGRTVVAHELGHWLEHTKPEVFAKSSAFLDRRRAGESAQPLSKLTGDKGYLPGEVAYKDNFDNPYSGKEYGGPGRRYATEILSMGLQKLLEEPVAFARKDPDYFKFVYNTLRGR